MKYLILLLLLTPSLALASEVCEPTYSESSYYAQSAYTTPEPELPPTTSNPSTPSPTSSPSGNPNSSGGSGIPVLPSSILNPPGLTMPPPPFVGGVTMPEQLPVTGTIDKYDLLFWGVLILVFLSGFGWGKIHERRAKKVKVSII